MNRTRWIFVGILAVVFLIIGVAVVANLVGGEEPTADTEFTLDRPETITVRVLTALPVERWVSESAAQFNASSPQIDGVPIEVEVIAMDGLTALGQWDRNEFGALEPDVRRRA